jgi:methylmalonyl-CoA/ethylmalonyl-CoA epimerase
VRLTRIHQVAARAPDLEKTRRFYQDVLKARFIASYDPPGLLFFDFAGTRVLFEREATNTTLYFWVDDIHAAYAELQQRGVDFDEAPHLIHRDTDGTFDNRDTEEWMAFFRDPGENVLAIATRR